MHHPPFPDSHARKLSSLHSLAMHGPRSCQHHPAFTQKLVRGATALAVSIAILSSLPGCSSTSPTVLAPDPGAMEDPYSSLTPETEPWPEWVFTPWAWEDESTQASVVDLVEGYLSRDIPLGAVIIDSPWETAYNTFEPDPIRFPDLRGLIQLLHSSGVRVILWTTGIINTDANPLYEEASRKGYFMTKGPGEPPVVVRWWKGQGSLIDFFNPEAVRFWDSLMDKALDLGADGFKVDMTDPYVRLAPYSPHLGREVTVLEYSRRYYGSIYAHVRQRKGKDGMITARPVDMNRRDAGGKAALASSHAPLKAGWAGWVGDQVSSFDPEHYSGIRGALLNYYYSSQLGYLAFGSDIGGYIGAPGKSLSPVLLLRWAGLGAFSPIMENGGIAEHRPWAYGEDVVAAYRRFARLHMALVPYILEHAPRLYAERRSLLSFVDRRSFSYLLGPDVFVQPITSPCGCAQVRLPDGSRWRYIFDSSEVYEGGTTLHRQFPLDEFPAYVRDGAPVMQALRAALEETSGPAPGPQDSEM